jgi:hypothetical protein
VNKGAGRFENALTEARNAIEINPDFALAYYNVAVNNAYLERFDQADAALRQGTAHGLEADEFSMLSYDIAFIQNDGARMERIAAQARQKYGAESWISAKEASARAYSGHLRESRSLLHRAIAEAEQMQQRERAALWEAAAAIREAFFGNSVEADERAAAALQLSENRDVEYGVAFALAFAGDAKRSREIADRLENRFPEDTSIRFNLLPVLRSRLALRSGEPQKALNLLEAVIPLELAVTRLSMETSVGSLYAIYHRGEAYLALREGIRAAAEFQKILDHRGIVISDPIGALAHLQVGRSFVLAGNKTRAKAAYDDFLTLWKDADPDIPILIQAKAEYEKLK